MGREDSMPDATGKGAKPEAEGPRQGEGKDTVGPSDVSGSPGGGGAGRPVDLGRLVDVMDALPHAGQVIDIDTLEVAAFALLKVLVGGGLRIPVKREGLVDMDILIKDNDVVFDVNSLQFGEHRLKVWHLTFAYQGTPIMEVGRGVKNGTRIYKFRAMRLLLTLWAEGRRRKRAAAASAVDAGDTASPGK